MRALALPFVVLFGACGIAASKQGPPSNAPASGLGPIAPLDDATGLSWVPPFILSDPSRTLAHPSVRTDGDAIDLWVEVTVAGRTAIARAHTERFEDTMALDQSFVAEQGWEAGAVSSPSVIDDDGVLTLFYVANGSVGVARASSDGTWMRRSAASYSDAGREPIRAVAAAAKDDEVRLVVLVGERDRVDELVLPRSALQDATPAFAVHRGVLVGAPSWGTSLLDVGLRVDRTATDRWREDVFFGVVLPAVADLGAAPTPTAVGAAARYLEGDDARFLTGDLPILSGSPPPRGATAVPYRGGVLVFYVARSGPRDAIGVGRWR